jgi:hypothetical protein
MVSAFAPNSSATSPIAILRGSNQKTTTDSAFYCLVTHFFTRLPWPTAPPGIAARELEISRETARNQLKSVFAKTDTHRQSELVALLMQVG